MSSSPSTPLNQPKLNPIQIWLLAARPKTLPAAAAPVIVGTAVAFGEGVFRLWPALAALAGALLLQIGSNLANDVFDFKKGADTADRLGPRRVTQAGLLSPDKVMFGMWLTFFLATIVGFYLVWVGGWPIVVIGLLSIASAIAYTGGPFPLGYNGLGDLFVFIFFGLIAVCGTYYVQAGMVSLAAIWASVAIGLLATAILVVNNLRDIDTDRAAGKKTLAVRFGATGARLEYVIAIALAYIIPLVMWLMGIVPVWVLLSWISIFLAVPLIRMIYTQTGSPLNAGLAGTARLELVYSLLFSIGMILGRWI